MDPPKSDGTYVGETRFHDGVMWIWLGRWEEADRPEADRPAMDRFDDPEAG